MNVINSVGNNTVKRISKLKLKKYRVESGEFLVEGYKNVLDTCNANGDSVRLVVLNESCFERYADDFSGFELCVIAAHIYDRLTETENGQGVMAIVSIPESAMPESDRCILLDRVRDPGNVGTILRTAAACGYDVIANDCADIYSPKVARSSMSALLKCRIGLDIEVETLKRNGYEIIAADMNGENVFKSAAPKGKYCIVIGNEADGVSGKIMQAADRALSIPMENMESLNAAVAAGVLMFELRYAAK